MADKPLTVQGDAVLLRLMLRNLLENAGRYSPSGTTIRVTLVTGQRYRSGAGDR